MTNHWIIAPLFFLATACNAHAGSGGANVALLEGPIGSEVQPCEGCPTFVRVPDAPTELRPIQLVAKYEVTWNDYLKSVDDGACSVPDPSEKPFVRYRKGEIAEYLDRFRIDWPITVWAPKDVECYLTWLKGKTGLHLDLPTHNEWQWFARSGHPDRKYPWGNDPSGGSEALKGKDMEGIEISPLVGGHRRLRTFRYFASVKVGQFAPSPWGLHDLMGNAYELTSDITPMSDRSKVLNGTSNIILGGSDRSDPKWSAEGIMTRRKVGVYNGQYSTLVGARLVVLEGHI